MKVASWFAEEASLACTTWSGPEVTRADSARARSADIVLLALVVALPWSTSATGILGIIAFLFILATIRTDQLLALMKHPISAYPVALVVLAAIGTVWANDVPLPERLAAVGKLLKFLLLPLLLVHFQFTRRAKWIFVAFIGSNLILLALSFLAFELPFLSISARLDQPGIPVKNYIDQSQGFALIAVILSGLTLEAVSSKRPYLALTLGLISGAFFANLIFVNIARTAFVYLPIMLLLLMMRYLNRRQLLIGVVGLGIICASLWSTSPNLQRKVSAIFTELAAFRSGAPIGEREPSAAERLEFWLKSLKFVETAPMLGHGTGSIRHLFQQDAVGKTGLSALVVGNPHNQTLAAAVQWGIVGVVIVWGMWLAHVRLFYGGELVAWIGMLAILQNIASSFFNSHLMDFYEGWLYVLAIGIAGGELLRIRNCQAGSVQGWEHLQFPAILTGKN